MKKRILIPCLLVLAACDSTAHRAANDCTDLNYKPGTADYEHCKIDMKKAEQMDSQDKTMAQ